MKLLIVLSLIACSYADKLDRTYLPPQSAATAGGSPGALNAPVGPSGSAGFGQPSGSAGFGQPSGSPGFGQPARASGFGQPSGSTGFGQPSGNAGFGQPAFGSSSFGKSTSGPAFGVRPSGSSGVAPSAQYGQPGLDAGFSQPAQNFGQGAQDYQRNQPQRAQASADQSAQILRSDSQNDGETFSYSFETSNGIAVEESGVATNGVQAQGAFSYSDDDGQNFRITYTADENGYQPQGDHLPTPHPIPEEIQKSIELNAQAAAAGTQEGAYNPDEDSSGSASYNYNAPTSYSQTPSGAGSFNQPQGPSQAYGALNAGASSRPQSVGQGFQSQGPSQQYGAPARPSDAFTQSQKAPSQLYGSPSNGAAPGFNGASQARPNNLDQSQGSSQQYGVASRPGVSGTLMGSSSFSPASSGFAPSGLASQPKPSQYQASQSGFPSARRPQGPAQLGQAQDESGYNYDRPQSATFKQASNGSPSPAGQYRPQNGGAQPSAPQGLFSRPNSNNGYPSGPAKGSFGASSGPSSQASFGPSASSNAFGPSSASKGPSSFGSPAGPSGLGSFDSSASATGQGPNSYSSASGLKGPSSFGPAGQGPNSISSSARPTGGSFGSSSATNGPSSFGVSAGANSFGRPQGAFAGAASKGATMPDAGYSYNRPGSAGAGSQRPQGSSSAPGSGPGQSFGGPRQPPSFTEEEGYKY